MLNNSGLSNGTLRYSRGCISEVGLGFSKNHMLFPPCTSDNFSLSLMPHHLPRNI